MQELREVGTIASCWNISGVVWFRTVAVDGVCCRRWRWQVSYIIWVWLQFPASTIFSSTHSDEIFWADEDVVRCERTFCVSMRGTHTVHRRKVTEATRDSTRIRRQSSSQHIIIIKTRFSGWLSPDDLIGMAQVAISRTIMKSVCGRKAAELL